jgi:nitrite reductase/ring-hydroxylating ferredoxin subunit
VPEEADWTKVATTADVSEGQGLSTEVEVAGDIVGLFCIDGEYYAVGECTHESGPIAEGQIDGHTVSCPWHSAQFDIRSGACLRGPVACRVDGQVAVGELEEVEHCDPLRCYDVKVEGDDIYVRPR